MTKTVRIENADMNPLKVKVEVWDQHPALGGIAVPDVLTETLSLDFPTAQLTSYIHSTRYLIVREA